MLLLFIIYVREQVAMTNDVKDKKKIIDFKVRFIAEITDTKRPQVKNLW